jgi:hypothetical protein
MKKLTFILLIFLSIYIQAQPVSNASDFDGNLSVDTYVLNVPTFNPGPSGENQIWDFSSITLNSSLYTVTSPNISETPFASSFLNSNYCYKSVFPSIERFQFYLKSDLKFEYTGDAETSYIVNYIDNKIEFEFPFTYNLVINDTYQKCPNCNVLQIQITYDAYGTLITPFGTFNNVIRKKTQEGINPSYSWFTVNPYTPIMAGSIGNIENVKFFISTNLSNSQNNFNSFSIYPNPTNENISIKNVNSIDKEVVVTIYDVLGNAIIKNKELNSAIENIELSDFSSGLYFVKITDRNNQILYSEKIVKQ